MNKKLLIALCVSLYAVQVAFLIGAFVVDTNKSGQVQMFSAVLLLLILLAFIAAVLNIIAASFCLQQNQLLGSEHKAFSLALKTKLILIPFYILNYVIWFLVAVVATVPMIFVIVGWMMWIVVSIASVFTYITMLATSSYVLAALFSLKKQKAIDTLEFVLFSALQLIFVTDIIGVIFLYSKCKKQVL